MIRVKIYHNPRCTKSRQTLALLEEQGCQIEVIEYLKNPPSLAELDSLCHYLELEPLALIRTKEAIFKELGCSKNDKKDRQHWLKLMHNNPVLIERPIVVLGKKAALGRPPEDVLKIL
jgi:arsenate reductase (glutaredoxin)